MIVKEYAVDGLTDPIYHISQKQLQHRCHVMSYKAAEAPSGSYKMSLEINRT